MRTIHLTGRLIRFGQSVLCALCFVLCACGNIFSSMSDAGLELSSQISSLRTDQLRNEYELYAPAEANQRTSTFTPSTDITVFALYPNGTIQEIPIQAVMITLLYGRNDEAGRRVEYGEGISFNGGVVDLGEWGFEVSYGGKSARFAFYVRTRIEDPVVSEPDTGSGIDIGIGWRN